MLAVVGVLLVGIPLTLASIAVVVVLATRNRRR